MVVYFKPPDTEIMEKLSQIDNILESESKRKHDVLKTKIWPRIRQYREVKISNNGKINMRCSLIAQQAKFHTASLKSKEYTFSWLCEQLQESTSTINSTIKRAIEHKP